MIPMLVIIFFSALILVWKGTLGLYFGFALMASSFGAMVWIQVRSFQLRRRLRQEVRARKAKWGGDLTVVSGLSSLTGMSCHLFITRFDELVVEDPVSERVIPLDEIERMALFYGKTLESMNDIQMGEAAGFLSVPRFYHVRAWIARNPRSKRRLFLAIRFQTPLTTAEYSEMAVFSDFRGVGNLDAFGLRPEIAVRTAVLPRKTSKKSKSRSSNRPLISRPTSEKKNFERLSGYQGNGTSNDQLTIPFLLDVKPTKSVSSKDNSTHSPQSFIFRETPPARRVNEQFTEPFYVQADMHSNGLKAKEERNESINE